MKPLDKNAIKDDVIYFCTGASELECFFGYRSNDTWHISSDYSHTDVELLRDGDGPNDVYEVTEELISSLTVSGKKAEHTQYQLVQMDNDLYQVAYYNEGEWWVDAFGPFTVSINTSFGVLVDLNL